MSVNRARQNVAWSEFERNMGIFHRDMKERLNAVPSRLKKFICPDIYNPMNRAYDLLIQANEAKRKTPECRAERQRLFRTAVSLILKPQKPLLAFMLLRDVSEGGAKVMIDTLNRELRLIWGVAGWKEAIPEMFVLPRQKIKQLAFLGVMAQLVKFTFGKLGHADQNCYDAVSVRIKDFVVSAWYHVLMANRKEPQTRAEAEEREKHINAALDCLNDMQRPLFSLWLIQDYSEAIMDEWAGLLDEEIRILTGLKDKDKQRYKDLK